MGKTSDRASGDLLFDDAGNVRLPRLTFIAISWALEQPWRCLTRQPTRERAEAVMEAVRDKCAARGLGLEIRPSQSSETFGLYVTPQAR